MIYEGLLLMVLNMSITDEKEAFSKTHTQFKTRAVQAHTLFMAEMAKTDTLFLTKTVKTIPFGAGHIFVAQIREYSLQ